MLPMLLHSEALTVERPIDDTLILRIADGDMEALHALYDSVRGAVFGFALSMVKNTHDADDVLQETFLKVYTNASAYRPQGKPLAWIFTIARHLATDKLRQRGRTAPADSDTAIDLSAVHTVDDRLLLEGLLASLSQEERQIVILHAVGGVKHREIAAILELPLGTVLAKYHRAIKRLKAIAEEESHHDR